MPFLSLGPLGRLWGFQGRGSISVKKAVNGKSRVRREQLGKEARLIAAIENSRNDLLRDSPMERRPIKSLRSSDKDIYKPDPISCGGGLNLVGGSRSRLRFRYAKMLSSGATISWKLYGALNSSTSPALSPII